MTAFNKKNSLYIEAIPFKTAVTVIEQFVMPMVRGVEEAGYWNRFWQAGGPWIDR